MITYPKFVDKNSIECYPQNEAYRYYLTIRFVPASDVVSSFATYNKEKRAKTAMIIMQNPSKANENCSDRTVNKVLNYLYEFGYGKVIIMNIIPFYGTKIETISKVDLQNKKILHKNCEEICKNSKKAHSIFAAWGWTNQLAASYYRERIAETKKAIKDQKIYCYSTNKSNNEPRHPRRWDKWKNEEEFQPLLY